MEKKLIEVCFTPKEYNYFKDKFDVVVVIDVLRATSAICSAFANGVKAVIPVETIEEARAYQNKGYLVGAERNGEIVDGFDFGNSPFSYLNPKLKGEEVVLSTTNGTRAIQMAVGAPHVLIASLINAEAIIQKVAKLNKNTVCLCSGWKDNFNLEDTICAGMIAEGLMRNHSFTSNEDSTIAAKYLYLSAKDNYFGFLKSSSHRRRLKRLNLNEDIKYCLNPNQLDLVPALKGTKIVLDS
ncbi:MAG: 2-phosphosulfolactate phosphatase [Crocinitomicaceae bacterium]|nr:2-phosphosulfolactate phosphatase [Crocinitomicaceae bacterium]